MKLALLVMDVQNSFFNISTATKNSLNEAIECINATIDLFREKQLPIIVIQHIDEEDNLVPDQKGFELPKILNILPSDTQIQKTYRNAFTQTPLKKTLEELCLDTVLISGFCAEYCVLSTYHGALDVDLNPILLQGSLASTTPKHIKFVEDISDIISHGALKKLLGEF